MKLPAVSLAFGLLLAIAGLPITGCFALGYAVGSSVDASNATASLAPLPSVSKMEEGELYRVVKIDSSVVLGEYVGLPSPDDLPSPDNLLSPHELYDRWRDADSSRRNMPRYLDSIEVILDSPVPRSLRGRLDRMSTDSLWVVGHSRPRLQIREISLHDVRTLTSTSGGRIEGQDLCNKTAGMVLPPPTTPPPSTLTLRHDAWSESVLPVDSIAYMSLMEIPSSARWVWMGVGMLVDAVVVGATLYAMDHMQPIFSLAH